MVYMGTVYSRLVLPVRARILILYFLFSASTKRDYNTRLIYVNIYCDGTVPYTACINNIPYIPVLIYIVYLDSDFYMIITHILYIL